MSYMFLCPTETCTQAPGDWHIKIVEWIILIKICGMNVYWFYKLNNQDVIIIKPYTFDYERPFFHHKVSFLWVPLHLLPF